MTDMTWEKLEENPAVGQQRRGRSDRLKFLLGGGLILAAVFYLVIMGTTSGTQYFITVEDILTNPDFMGDDVRISGVVLGDTIEYNSEELIIDFTIAHIPKETSDLARTLYEAANDETAMRLSVHIENEVMPDLLQHEAQAILTGSLGEDGVFYANELLLKCPSRYEESSPGQVMNEGDA